MEWAIVVKKDKSGWALPTMREVIEGIINFLIDQIEKSAKKLTKKQITATIRHYRLTFADLI